MTKVYAILSNKTAMAIILAVVAGMLVLSVNNVSATHTQDANGAPIVHPANPDLLEINDLGIDYGRKTGLGEEDVRDTVARIIKVAMGLLGIVAVVIVLIGGFTWMTAGGNEEKVAEAKKWIFAGIIGLAIILSAYAIAKFVLEQLYVATTQGELN